MNKQLIVITSLLCALNGQGLTYTEWHELTESAPNGATMYMYNIINGQQMGFEYCRHKMTTFAAENKQNTPQEIKDYFDRFFAMPPDSLSIDDLGVLTMAWIQENPLLWHLTIANLCIYARFDIFGDVWTQRYIQEKIISDLNSNL